MRIGLGIDTGGTYTDAVAFDLDEKSILESAKALTTRENLSEGILAALDGISAELLFKAEILSLSTTLATNACVENKGGNAKLIIFGGDSKVIDKLGGAYGLPSSQDIYLQESFTTFAGDTKREPNWELFNKEIATGYEHLDCIGIVEINAMRTGALAEKKAKLLFEEQLHIPAICGHELFSNLNYLQRGSSALLNARLFPVIQEFLDAIKAAVTKKGIQAKLIIMRSDGSVMSEEFATLHPIETLLCGPAASISGGLHLSHESNCIVVDMGGTTTDISLISNGVPKEAEGGVSLGKWKTFVDGLYNKTIGLGGDSAIHYDKAHLRLEEYRVVPLCVAAGTFPVIKDNLERLLRDEGKHSKFIHEHLILVKNIEGNNRYTSQEQNLCRALEQGPLAWEDAALLVGKDAYSFNVTRLVKEGIVQVCGLTPTDIMHIRQDFTRYSTEAAELGAQFVARNLGITVDELCTAVYREIRRKLYLGIVGVLLENQDKHYKIQGLTDEAEKFINMSFDIAEKQISAELATQGLTAQGFDAKGFAAKDSGSRDSVSIGSAAHDPNKMGSAAHDPNVQGSGSQGSDAQGSTDQDSALQGSAPPCLVTPSFTTSYSLVGTGAPIRVFLDEVAQLLGTRAVIPDNYEVANAVGAITGNIEASCSVRIVPQATSEFVVYGNDGNKAFLKLEDAEEFALDEAEFGAQQEALVRGAKGELTVFSHIERQEAEAINGPVHLGSTAVARAVGGLFGD